MSRAWRALGVVWMAMGAAALAWPMLWVSRWWVYTMLGFLSTIVGLLTEIGERRC